MTIRRRLDSLEALTPPPAPVRPGGVTWHQLQALEARIRRQEAGTGAVPTSVPASFLEEPDPEIEAVERHLLLLEEMEDRHRA